MYDKPPPQKKKENQHITWLYYELLKALYVITLYLDFRI